MNDDKTEKPRVLLVDDDPDVLIELSEGLASLGLPVLTAETPVAAIDLVQRNEQLQVVVTDLQMPRIDGIELLQKLTMLRQKRPLATIIITGHASLDRAVGALRLNAVDFLQKPVLPEEVAHSIRRALALVEDSQKAAAAVANGNGGGDAVPAKPVNRPNYLKALVAARADRDAIFQSGLFSDPAWDMLLDLAVAEASGRPISVTSLCIASGAPTTTALRRIDELKEAGLLDRRPDPMDRRRIIVELTDLGRSRMEAFVKRQAERLGLPLD
ncbi:response regulator [Ancylobacter sp. SL191]|jgi:CheY-like chemotaxis protein|uniref:response regulator n=1 Tax=Ancylobacter sp. SL191 TaxID=2995166 RepID=UPI00227010F4|nr:response regulator [Ancylobacter sp. SL191]WAC29013.1 response regulator [Ancylobacter sp. SL191]